MVFRLFSPWKRNLNFGEKFSDELNLGSRVDEGPPLLEERREDRKRRLVADDSFAQKLVHRFPLVGEKGPIVNWRENHVEVT